MACYGIDVTERRQHQEEARAARIESEKMIRLREAFLDNLSHEFRTPLTGILGAAQVLSDAVDEPELELVDIVVRNGRRLMNTLGAMLDLAGLKAEGKELRPRVVNVVKEVQEVARSLGGFAQEKGLFLRVNPTHDEVLVRVDPDGLYRILYNVLGNAVKFTETGGVLVDVDFDDAHAHIRVIDSGVGIEHDYLPNLFDEFTQESLGVDRAHEGVGIGLPITKRLIDLMRGSIRVDSEKGEGSIFVLSFPLAFPAAPDQAKGRVLLADASEETEELVRYLLDPYFAVTVATDWDALLAQAEQHRFDVVLLDAALGGETSAEAVLAALRALPAYEDVPVAAMDVDSLRSERQEQLLEAGFDHYLAKPLKKQNVLNVVGDLLATTRLVA